MEYRKEIDGLRAVAVIPVILFHAGFEVFSGGFVGVDVFFVISGYLITTIILSEKENGKFSLVNFYERRARRILPALFLVMLVSILMSWFLLPPSHMQDFSQSLVAVSVFSSNLLFWMETGYWGVENELKPLLHTWSLAVEEQYYVLFPLFIMSMWRFPRRWMLGAFFLLAITSLALCQWATFNEPDANFFLLPTRAWELAIGAGIAFYFIYRKPAMRSLLLHKMLDELMGILGLLMIAYAVFYFDENTPFPSVYALIPTIGAALIIIFASKDTLSGKLLSSRYFVGVGLISYSAYLWHQPLFVFARHKSLHEPSSVLFAVLSIITLVAAFISWKFVEAPFRKKGVIPRLQVFLLSVIGTTGFIAFGLAGHFSEGFKSRLDQKLAEVVSLAEKKSYIDSLCVSSNDGEERASDYCVLVPNPDKSVFLYGDSHARALMYEAKKSFENSSYGLIYAATVACPPVKGIFGATSADKAACYEQNNGIYEYIVDTPSIEYVVLVARWPIAMEGTRFNNQEGGVEHGSKQQFGVVKGDKFVFDEGYSHQDLISTAFTDSIEYLLFKGKKVILVHSIPEAGWNVPDYITRSYWVNPDTLLDLSTASTSYKVFKERNERVNEAFEKVASGDNLFHVYPESIFCDKSLADRCITHRNGVIYYSDDDHLSNAGARLVLEQIVSKLE